MPLSPGASAGSKAASTALSRTCASSRHAIAHDHLSAEARLATLLASAEPPVQGTTVLVSASRRPCLRQLASYASKRRKASPRRSREYACRRTCSRQDDSLPW